MQLSTAGKLFYVAAILTSASLGAANMLSGRLPDAALAGAEPPVSRPQLTRKTVWDETFQRDAFKWFRRHWGLRGYAVRMDNTFNYRLFGESGAAVVGVNGILFPSDDIAYLNRDYRADTPRAIAMAKRYGPIQKALRARGKVMVPVLLPAKTTFMPDAVPADWQRRRASKERPEDLGEVFARTLREEGTTFLDARPMALYDARQPDEVFAAPARHWRASAGCRALNAALDLVRPELPEIGNEKIDCRVKQDPNPPDDAKDYDLYQLLNVWGRRPPTNVEMFIGPDAGHLDVPTLFVGCSYMFKFTETSRRLGVLTPSTYYYYDTTAWDVMTNTKKKVQPFTDGWRKDTFGKRLLIVGVLETQLPERDESETSDEKFLREMEKELGIPTQNLK